MIEATLRRQERPDGPYHDHMAQKHRAPYFNLWVHVPTRLPVIRLYTHTRSRAQAHTHTHHLNARATVLYVSLTPGDARLAVMAIICEGAWARLVVMAVICEGNISDPSGEIPDM